MASAIVMPALSPTMTEGKIVKWNKKEGDAVKAGDEIAEVETDKATLALEAYESGTLLKILVPEGKTAAVGGNVGVIGKAGEDVSSFQAGGPAKAAEAPAEKKPAAAAPAPAAPARPATPPPQRAPVARPAVSRPAPEAPRAAAAPSGGRIKASPLAKRMAKETGVDLSSVAGSGPGGRIVAKDVQEAMSRPKAAPAAERAPAARAEKPAVPPLLSFPERPREATIELSGMRKSIATRMTQAKNEIPHFYLTIDVDMEACVALRTELKELGLNVSINDFVLKAAGFGLLKIPEMNRSFQGDSIQQWEHVDVGMAVAIPDGLITPVIRDIDQLPLSAVAQQSKAYAERARNKKLKPEEYTGGSVTVSNLGMFGIDTFIAIVNPPQSAILAVGQVAEKPVGHQGQLALRKRMSITLSGDHRVIDGAIGARYLQEVKNALERPVALLA